MPKTYVTFGQDHRHVINNVVYDKDCVAVIECHDELHGRELAFEHFGRKWCFEYHEKIPNMQHFPRGIIRLETQ